MLGIVYVDTPNTLQLNMRFQIDTILECYQMIDCSIKKTPAPSGLVLLPADQQHILACTHGGASSPYVQRLSLQRQGRIRNRLVHH